MGWSRFNPDLEVFGWKVPKPGSNPVANIRSRCRLLPFHRNERTGSTQFAFSLACDAAPVPLSLVTPDLDSLAGGDSRWRKGGDRRPSAAAARSPSWTPLLPPVLLLPPDLLFPWSLLPPIHPPSGPGWRSSRPRRRRAVVERRCRARWCSRPRPGGRAAGHSDAASRVWEEEQQGMTAQQATVGLRRASRDEGAVHSGNDGGTAPEKKTEGGGRRGRRE